MQTINQIVGIPAVSVFLGTLPLLGTILWGLPQNERRLSAIEKHMDSIESKIERYGEKINSSETKIAVIETRLDGPRLFTKS